MENVVAERKSRRALPPGRAEKVMRVFFLPAVARPAPCRAVLISCAHLTTFQKIKKTYGKFFGANHGMVAISDSKISILVPKMSGKSDQESWLATGEIVGKRLCLLGKT